MLFSTGLPELSELRVAINKAYHQDETEVVSNLLEQLEYSDTAKRNVKTKARLLMTKLRELQQQSKGIDSLLQQYDLSSQEGIALMCVAEALLRIPDSDTRDRLIRDKLTNADWRSYIGEGQSLFVNAATWGLMLTGKVLSRGERDQHVLSKVFRQLLSRTSEPVIRNFVSRSMTILGKQFVMGRNIEEAMRRAKDLEAKGYTYSYDMLGEAARTMADAERYYRAYEVAINSIGAQADRRDVRTAPGISVKLSALHPRYEFSQCEKVVPFLAGRLLDLCLLAKKHNIGLTIDAEEAERLDISLDIIERVFTNDQLGDWQGFGVVVQSYQKRAMAVIDWLAELSKSQNRRMCLRLIKGAYWDSEIKHAQVNGYHGYPVFTRKQNTDVSFLTCAQKLFTLTECFYPMFGTHNAKSLAAVIEFAGDYRDFEFQCLHGMGQPLYDQVVGADNDNIPCRIYAPVGGHKDLLAYLVRRLLENGANTSFVNRISDRKAPLEDLLADSVDKVRSFDQIPHPKIPLPEAIYGETRRNSSGVNLTDIKQLSELQSGIDKALNKTYIAKPTIGTASKAPAKTVSNPADTSDSPGQFYQIQPEHLEEAISKAQQAFHLWSKTPAEKRAAFLCKAADLLEQHAHEFYALAIREAGKTIPDAVAELREAVDFCRYYAEQCIKLFAKPMLLPGPTGEYNHLSLHGRGVMACISPWNFPLAIFIGQVTACLAAGNTVLAKPAEQTPLIAARAVELLHEAGIPKFAVQLVPGRGSQVGPILTSDYRIQGVVFTGSTETAQQINMALAERAGPIVPLIAETGGQNAMIVDSSALPEQVVADVINSAFGSAGQRCSALRVLYVQEDIADSVIKMLTGAMAELRLGDPNLLSTDVGPVIDGKALVGLNAHIDSMCVNAKLLYQVPLTKQTDKGNYCQPSLFEIQSISQLDKEVFGPVLHLIRYQADEIDQVIDEINATGFGLTFGIQTRIEETATYLHQRIHAGNTYVNRNMTGAVVGVQPFGGEGLSGTGPKAGGPHYLLRLCTERTLTIDTTAAGGNASLLSLID